MKRLIAAVVLLATAYFTIFDGLMVHFDLSRGIQYAFNMGAIFLIMPVSLFFMLGMELNEYEG